MRPSWHILLFLFLQPILEILETALPPGFDEELYCPGENFCLRHKRMPRGWCGPRAHTFVCCNRTANKECGGPRAWGAQLDQAEKDRFLPKGIWFLMNEQSPCAPPFCPAELNGGEACPSPSRAIALEMDGFYISRG